MNKYTLLKACFVVDKSARSGWLDLNTFWVNMIFKGPSRNGQLDHFSQVLW